MKTFMQYLSLLLCFELIMSPINLSLINSASAQQSTCAAGQNWNNDLNRCLTSDQTIQMNEAAVLCGSDKNCYVREATARLNATNASKENAFLNKDRDSENLLDEDGKFKSPKAKGIAQVGNAAAIAIPTFIATYVLIKHQQQKKNNPGFSCKPASLILMYGAAAALGAGEVIGYFNHKSKINDIQEEWEAKTAPTLTDDVDKKRADATEQQSQAFEFLAQNEEQVGKTAKLKKGFYIAATSLFGAGAVMATIEQIQLGMAKKQVKTTGPGLISKGTTMLGSDATKIEGQQLINKGKDMITKGKQKISKLTCATQESKEGDKALADDKSREDGIEQGKKDQQKLDADKQKGFEDASKRSENYDSERERLEDEKIKLENKAKEDPSHADTYNERAKKYDQKIKDLDAQHLKDQKTINDYNNPPKPEPAKQSATPIGGTESQPPKGTHMGSTYTKSACQGIANSYWFSDTCWVPKPGSGTFVPYDSKVKRVAAYNISTAQDAEQLMQLVKEYENIEFENYSKVSYLDEEVEEGLDIHQLKSIKLDSLVSKLTASLYMDESYAQTSVEEEERKAEEKAEKERKEEEAKAKKEQEEAEKKAKKEKTKSTVMSIGGMALTALLPMILKGGIKFKNGKTMAPGELQKETTLVKDPLLKALGQPYTRIAINGVLGGWMGVMWANAGKQAKLSEERAKKLRELKESFNSGSGIAYCSPADRKDAKQPKCYCYTSDNQVNPARAKDQACVTALKSLNQIKTLGGPTKTCVSADYKMDPSCSCKAKNNCLKPGQGFSYSGFNPSVFKMMNAGVGPATDLFNGNSEGGDISEAAGTNAAKLQKIADDMLAKNDPQAAKDSKTAAKELENSLLATTSGMAMSGTTSTPLPSSPKAAAAALMEEIKKKDEAVAEEARMSSKGGAGFDTMEDGEPEISLPAGDEPSVETEVAEVMDKEIDYGNNADVNNSSDTNLFDVLSNRYRRSGMRRLFDDAGTKEADAPAKTDIAD